MLAGFELEYIDPVAGACELPKTEDLPLPEDASTVQRNTAAMFPILIPGWWADRA